MSSTPFDAEFFVAGVPVPKGSTKPRLVRGKGGKVVAAGVVADNEDRQRAWAAEVAKIAREAWHGLDVWYGEVEVITQFVIPVVPPGGRTARQTAMVRSVGDGDKLTRCVWDALTGIVYGDDSQVTVWGGSKRLADDGEQPGVRVFVRLLGDLA